MSDKLPIADKIVVRFTQWIAKMRIFKERSPEAPIKTSEKITQSWRRFDARHFSVMRVGFVIATIAAAMVFIMSQVYYYFTYFPPKEYRDQAVMNLTADGVMWDVFYGKSARCGEMDCHLLTEYDAKQFTKKMVLPAREFPLLGFKKGQDIYLRTTVQLRTSMLDSQDSIKFQTFYIWAKRYEFYLNGILLETGAEEYVNITLPRPIIEETRGLIHIAIKIDAGELDYQGLANRGDVVIGPKNILNPLQHLSVLEEENSVLWTLLPQVAVCLIFCFMFMVFPHNNEFFSFIMYAFLVSLKTFMVSSYPGKVIPIKFDFFAYSDLPQIASSIFFMIFAKDFFRLRIPYFNRIMAVLLITTFVIVVGGIQLQTNYGYYAREIMNNVLRWSSILFGTYAAAYSLVRIQEAQGSVTRLRISAFMLLTFGFMLVSATLRSYAALKDLLGIDQTILLYFFNTAFDFIFFFVVAAVTSIEFGMTQTAKDRLESKLEAIELRLELANSVQQLLIPASLQDKTSAFDFRFFYEPADKMSGDWLYVWKTPDGETRLFIGDVVGKGPQAALAVSAIVSVINFCKHNNYSVEECIEALNKQILELFKSKVGTTLSAIALRDNNTATVYNCGAIGWLLMRGAECTYLPLRGKSLGTDPKVSLAKEELSLGPDSTLLAFTDGVLEGSRALRQLTKKLKEASEQHDMSFDNLHLVVTSTGKEHVLDDDKTLLVIRSAA